MNVRPAAPSDLPAILEMSAKFYPLTSYSERIPFDPESTAVLAEALVQQHVLLVAEDCGRTVGMVGALLFPFAFNGKFRHAQEVVYWVEPEARGSSAAQKLIKGLRDACDWRGVHLVSMVNLHNSPPAAAAMYEHAGYTLAEQTWARFSEINTPTPTTAAVLALEP